MTIDNPVAPIRSSRRLALAGWLSLLVVAIAWCVTIMATSVMWEHIQAPEVPQGQTWVADQISFQVNTTMKGTRITLPNQAPILSTDGAVFVLVVLDYTRAPEAAYFCSMTLLGRDRDWRPASGVYFKLDELVPGASRYCTETDADDDPITEGVLAELFEIPASALEEIRGVRLQVSVASDDFLDLKTLFTKGSWAAVMLAEIPG